MKHRRPTERLEERLSQDRPLIIIDVINPAAFGGRGSIIMLEFIDEAVAIRVAERIALETGRVVTVRREDMRAIATIPRFHHNQSSGAVDHESGTSGRSRNAYLHKKHQRPYPTSCCSSACVVATAAYRQFLKIKRGCEGVVSKVADSACPIPALVAGIGSIKPEPIARRQQSPASRSTATNGAWRASCGTTAFSGDQRPEPSGRTDLRYATHLCSYKRYKLQHIEGASTLYLWLQLRNRHG